MQPQLPVIQFDMNDFMAHQQQMAQANERQHQHMHHVNQHMQPMQQHQQGREAHEVDDEPVVGSPLGLGLGVKSLSLNPLGLGLHPLGLGFHNFNAGRIGGLHFANSLLGAGNPMEADNNDPQLERHHHHHFDNNLGTPKMQQFGADMPQRHLDSEPQLAAPQQPQGFWPWHHFANPDSELGAAIPQELGAPQQFQPQAFQSCSCPAQPQGPPMQFQPMVQQEMVQQIPMEDGARTWGKWGKGHHDYGYG